MYPLNSQTLVQKLYLKILIDKVKFKHPLMNNNYTNQDMTAVRNLLKNRNIVLTQSKKVEEFEKNGQNGLKSNIPLLLIRVHLQIIFLFQC